MSLILVVDDHAATREPLAKLLRYQGYETAEACNGAEALEALRERKPDLVLLDLLMPTMDGVTFLSHAKEEPHATGLPVIVVTGGRAGVQLRNAGDLPGVVDMIRKAQFTVDGLLTHNRPHLAD